MVIYRIRVEDFFGIVHSAVTRVPALTPGWRTNAGFDCCAVRYAISTVTDKPTSCLECLARTP